MASHEETAGDASLVSVVRDCPDCVLPVDLVVESSDGIRFATHGQNVYTYSARFPPAVPTVREVSTISLSEHEEVVALLLQCMHLRPQPALAKLPFEVLSELAEAAEKYLIYSIMPVCMMSMASHIQHHPIDVLKYASKYGYNDLANEAAPYTVDLELSDVKSGFEKNSIIPYRWLEYREQWVTLLRSVHSEEPQAVLLHKGGVMECELWRPFYKDVLASVGMSSLSLKGFNDTIMEKMQTKLHGCVQCCNRARRWGTSTMGKVKSFQLFEDFL